MSSKSDNQSFSIGTFDLHMHSNASDGTLSPAELVDRAFEFGVETLSLTDHDTLGGLASARATASKNKQNFITGVELTVNWSGRTLHLLGLNFDMYDAGFDPYLDRLVQLRNDRAEKIAKRLNKKGISEELLGRAKTLAGEGQIGRPHFAQALIDLGRVNSMQQAFDLYLGQGRTGDVKAEWPEFSESIDLVKSAGGAVLLAHPTKYKMTFTKLRELMTDLLNAGADGLEVSYPGVSPGHMNELIRLAEQRDCSISAGSDFHSPDQRWTALGRYPSFNTDRLILGELSIRQ